MHNNHLFIAFLVATCAAATSMQEGVPDAKNVKGVLNVEADNLVQFKMDELEKLRLREEADEATNQALLEMGLVSRINFMQHKADKEGFLSNQLAGIKNRHLLAVEATPVDVPATRLRGAPLV